MELDWGNLVEDWDGEIVGEIRPRRIVLDPGEFQVIPPTWIVYLRVEIMRRP